MDFVQAFQNVEQHVKSVAVSAAEQVEQHLPVIGAVLQQVATNPAMEALASAVHLPGAPEVLAELALTIQKIDAAIGAAKEAGAAAANAAAQQPPAEPPAA